MTGNARENEKCFGFHSEYYINSRWRFMWRGEGVSGGGMAGKGYMEYSKYGNYIYFLPRVESNVIIKCNPATKEVSMISLNTRTKIRAWNTYIAVNRQGYFLYNTQTITLFGFDGQEIYTYRFGQKNYIESIYVYDSIVIYSETRTEGICSEICCVDMISGESRCLWKIQKGDAFFDQLLRQSYKEKWGEELPFFPNPSNIGNISCEFLYRNKKRVVAGYTREKGENHISYIVNIDLATGRWNILDCFATGNSKYSLPSAEDRHIFSFDMMDDSMWVKTGDENIGLVHTEIQEISQLQGNDTVEWKLCNCTYSCCYYFDGRQAYIPDIMDLIQIERNGEKKLVECHNYQTTRFWCFDDIYIIPNELDNVNFRGLRNGYRSIFTLKRREVEALLDDADNDFSEQRQDNTISLAEFRRHAPQAVGVRESLLSYRKSLENIWDYNAYVGILLGVGSSKHGDAACRNYAIGQGDNGSSTKKTLEAKGLIRVFEKYKGKKIDETILLSEVEDEIVVIAPEYEEIRENFHKIMEDRFYG